MMLSSHRKSFYTVITIIGLGYFVAFATIQCVADWLGGTIPFFDYYHVPFIVLFLLSIFLVWTRPRIGYFVEHNRSGLLLSQFSLHLLLQRGFPAPRTLNSSFTSSPSSH